MRVLVHICCGPCAITVLRRLMEQGHEPTGLFFNPNIHPLAEYMRRREGAAQVAQRLGIPLLFADTLPEEQQHWSFSRQTDEAEPLPFQEDFPPAVNPALWFRETAGREKERCAFCCDLRLRKSAELAARWNFPGFTSSLLYSRYQDHEALRQSGADCAQRFERIFVYEDFRSFWQEGIALSKEWGIYRQQYCGCLFSEYDRYRRDFTRLRASKANAGTAAS